MTRKELEKFAGEYKYSSLNDELTAIRLTTEISNRLFDRIIKVLSDSDLENISYSTLKFIIDSHRIKS